MQSHTLASYPTLDEFLQRQVAATIAVPVDATGTIHAASLLYWNSTNPLAFYFVSGRDTEKARLLKNQQEIPCAAVVGTEKGTDFTLQMRGTLREGTAEELELYYQKRGNRFDDVNDPKNMCLVFTPTWARFTDCTKDYTRYTLEV